MYAAVGIAAVRMKRCRAGNINGTIWAWEWVLMESIWLANHHQRYGSLRGEERADVAVVGGGVAGLTAAYLLSAAGVGVAVVEAGCVGSGQSARGAAMVTFQHGLCFARLIRRFGRDRAGRLVKAYDDAVHLVAGIVTAEGIGCDFLPQDSFVYTTDPRRAEAVEREAEAASLLGFSAGVTNAAPFLFPYVVAAYVRNQAALHPAKYSSGLAAAIVRNGGRVYEGSPAIAVKDGAVHTDAGRLRAKCVVIATGVPILSASRYGALRVWRRTGWAAAAEGLPTPAGLWQDEADGLSFRAAAGRLIACSGDARGGGDIPQEAFLKRLEQCLPGITPAVWPVQSVHTLDGLPDVGKYAADGGCLFVATGVGRWGIMGGSLAGHVLCDIVLDRPNPAAELFSPQRLPDAAAIGSAVARGISAGWRIVAASIGKRRSAL